MDTSNSHCQGICHRFGSSARVESSYVALHEPSFMFYCWTPYFCLSLEVLVDYWVSGFSYRVLDYKVCILKTICE